MSLAVVVRPLHRPRDRHRGGAARDGAPLAGRPRTPTSTCPTDRGPSAPRAGVSTADAVAAVLWVGLTLYAVFGGADFGSGLWALLAGRGERGKRRARPDRLGDRPRLGGQPRLADLRAGHALDGVPRGLRRRSCRPCSSRSASRPSGSCCAAPASPSTGWPTGGSAGVWPRPRSRSPPLLTPFFMGTVVGAVASGRVPVGNAEGDPVTSWLNPISLLIGVLFVGHRRVPRGGVPGQRRPPASATRSSRATSPCGPRRGAGGRGAGVRRDLRPARRRALHLRRPDERGPAARAALGAVRPGRAGPALARQPARRPAARRRAPWSP